MRFWGDVALFAGPLVAGTAIDHLGFTQAAVLAAGIVAGGQLAASASQAATRRRASARDVA